MEPLYLPVLSHFQNGNLWTGSAGRLRYRLVPDETQITAEVWEGPWSYALSRVEECKPFPLDEEGLKAIVAWIEAWTAEINARPERSLADTLQMRTTS